MEHSFCMVSFHYSVSILHFDEFDLNVSSFPQIDVLTDSFYVLQELFSIISICRKPKEKPYKRLKTTFQAEQRH